MMSQEEMEQRITALESKRMTQKDYINNSVKQRHIDGLLTFTGTLADRPTGASEVQQYFATDTNTLYIWNGSSWDAIPTPGLTVRNIAQKNLASSFVAAAGTSEQEVTGMRVTLPIVSTGSSSTVKITLKIYITTVAGDNTVRVRLGTSTSYLTNTGYDNLYVSGAKTLETFTGIIVVPAVNLTVQNYVVVSYQNSVDATGANFSSSGARSTIVTEVYT